MSVIWNTEYSLRTSGDGVRRSDSLNNNYHIYSDDDVKVWLQLTEFALSGIDESEIVSIDDICIIILRNRFGITA